MVRKLLLLLIPLAFLFASLFLINSYEGLHYYPQDGVLDCNARSYNDDGTLAFKTLMGCGGVVVAPILTLVVHLGLLVYAAVVTGIRKFRSKYAISLLALSMAIVLVADFVILKGLEIL
ncbi:MAG: hypothetical protein COT88_02355 [Candidatus Colwellbacteria bacterium CG10_big_fil_rev_8_21_14_0_10_41_28]|uniref:Uncharacterized protein n=1 Tax=Candidatus Colwellbacteria bacterium CG10_big_fil_rev_8_21_14_0_10_41_28 TaxID=1974539 RepID=A0A2H0VGU9_9BACT|nr:MAG: hypothetical protein COT88_02355 [Candidatus Colwellbacteria bacterium CG10_big_fil_rev_8_21_14_0_10_41_28]